MIVVVEALDGGFLDGSVHPLDLAVGPGVLHLVRRCSMPLSSQTQSKRQSAARTAIRGGRGHPESIDRYQHPANLGVGVERTARVQASGRGPSAQAGGDHACDGVGRASCSIRTEERKPLPNTPVGRLRRFRHTFTPTAFLQTHRAVPAGTWLRSFREAGSNCLGKQIAQRT